MILESYGTTPYAKKEKKNYNSHTESKHPSTKHSKSPHTKYSPYKPLLSVATELNGICTYNPLGGELQAQVSFTHPSSTSSLHTIGGDTLQLRNGVVTTKDSHCLIVPLITDISEDSKEEDKEPTVVAPNVKIIADIKLGGSKCNGSAQCWSDENKLAVFSDSYLLSVWNINDKKCIWKAKNLPNDYLNLTIPINDLDCKYDRVNPYKLYTSTAQGEV